MTTTTHRPFPAGHDHPRRAGFTVWDLLVVIVILVALAGLLLPAITPNRVINRRLRCAANLRNIATHAFIYANRDIRSGGKYPRTYFDPAAPLDRSLAGNAMGATSFAATRPAEAAGVNNPQSAFYLLMKETDMYADTFICPEGEAVRAYDGNNLTAHANWPAPYAAFNSYSYHCPYLSAAALAGGWRYDPAVESEFPLASDLNPGDTSFGGPTSVAYTADRKAMRAANSPNHWFEGQQVVYCDIHIEWQTSPFCGLSRPGVPYRDNIFASAAGGVDAAGKGGTVWAAPQDPADAVLLPTAQDSPGSKIAARAPAMAPPRPPGATPLVQSPEVWAIALAVGLWAVVNARQGARRQAGRAAPTAPPPDGPGEPPHAGV